jgi:hypothetical protein
VKTEDDMVARILAVRENVGKGQVFFRGCVRTWGMEAMPSTNSVAVTSNSPYELTVNNTIKTGHTVHNQ